MGNMWMSGFLLRTWNLLIMPDGLMLWLTRRRHRLWNGFGSRGSLSGLSGGAWNCGKRRLCLFSLGSFGIIALNWMALRLLDGCVMGGDIWSVDSLAGFGKTGAVLWRKIKLGVLACNMEIVF